MSKFNKQRTVQDGAAVLEPGLVVATYGRHCLVETPEGRRLICHPRGKKNQVVVGDQVLWQIAGDEGSIEKLQERRNLFYRQDEIRTKSFAANLDRVLILIAADPEYSESQLSRALVAAEAERITPVIALNKSDLAQPFAQAWERLAPYRAMGYSVMPISLSPRTPVADDGVAALCEHLTGHTTLVLGPSGSGKSTLINRLVPDAQVETGEISQALNSGKHTTTSTRWYWVPSLDRSDARTALIDSRVSKSLACTTSSRPAWPTACPICASIWVAASSTTAPICTNPVALCWRRSRTTTAQAPSVPAATAFMRSCLKS